MRDADLLAFLGACADVCDAESDRARAQATKDAASSRALRFARRVVSNAALNDVEAIRAAYRAAFELVEEEARG